MRRVFLFFIFLFFIFFYTQTPGGVINNSLWLEGNKNFFQKKVIYKIKEVPLNNFINYNQSFNFKNQLRKIELRIKSTEEISLFIVSKIKSSEDNYLNIYTGKNEIRIFPNSINSVKTYKYNFTYGFPNFISYIENFEGIQRNTSSKESKIKFSDNEIEGDIAEVLFFNRCLSPLERLRVESYFSIKYGISLPQNSDYINSYNDKIFESKKNKDFLNEVTGIGRDDNGNLYQKQSSNVLSNNFLIIGLDKILKSNELNKSEINDLSYLIWSDDGKELSFKENENNNEILLLQKSYQALTLGNGISAKDLALRFSLNKILFDNNNVEGNTTNDTIKNNNKNEKLYYWLVIDRNSEKKIDIMKSEFQLINIDKETMIGNINKIKFDKDNSGKDLFTVALAPDFFVLTDNDFSSCASNMGTLHVKIVGGISPYKYSIINNATQEIQTGELLNNEISLNDFIKGKYTISIQDFYKRNYLKEIQISNSISNDNLAQIDNEYILDAKPIEIKLLDNNNSYIWYLDNKKIGDKNIISINKEGKYTLITTTKEGCKYQKQFLVRTSDTSIFKNYTLYPNPVKARVPFTLSVDLKESHPATIFIYDFNGALLSKEYIDKTDTINYTTIINQTGIYNVKISTAKETKFIKLIVD